MKDLLQYKKYGNTPFKSRVLSLLLSFALFLSMCPQVVLFTAEAVEKAPISVEEEMLQAVREERIAIFDNWSEFLLSKDPKTDEGEYLEYDAIGAKGLVVKILDAYYDKETGSYWYQIGPHSTSALPAGMGEYTWVQYTTDFDLECNYQPYLALYSADQTIRFVDVQYTLDGETVESYIVVAGPAALKRTIITAAEVTTPYETSAMSYYYEDVDENGELVVEAWHRSFHIEVLKDTGPWQPEDGELSMRFMANQALNSSDSYYMGAFLYAGDKLQDFAAVDYWASASGVVYTGEGIVDLNLEMLCESFEPVCKKGFFSSRYIQLSDCYFGEEKKTLSGMDLYEEFVVEGLFCDEMGLCWYWIEDENFNEGKYFLIEMERVSLMYDGEPLNATDAKQFLLNAGTIADFDNILQFVSDDILDELMYYGDWEAIEAYKILLVYSAFYSVSTEAEFHEIAEKYPEEFAQIQADPEMKAHNDQRLEYIRYLEANPLPPVIEYGEPILAGFFNGFLDNHESEEEVQSRQRGNESVLKAPALYQSVAGAAIERQAFYGAALMAAGESGSAGDSSGVELTKTVTPVEGKDGEYVITLEAYTTGTEIVVKQEKEVPTDIILVLDLSRSMDNSISGTMYRSINAGNAQDVYLNHANELYVNVNGEYKKVTITAEGKTTEVVYTQYTDGRKASTLYDNRNQALYYRVAENDYRKITVTKSSNKYTATYEGGGTILDNANGNTNIDNLQYSNIFIQTSQEVYTRYTFTYADADGNTVSHTYNADESVVGGTNPVYYAQSTQNLSRADALDIAVNNFVAAVAKKAKGKDGEFGGGDDVPHRVAIVGFSGEGQSGTGLYINGSIKQYKSLDNDIDNTYKIAYHDMSIQSQSNGAMDSLGALIQNTGTHMYAATEMALKILEHNNNDPDRNKVVVLFTDGEPNGLTGNASYNEPILDAHAMKNTYGASVYSVGILSNASTSPVVEGTTTVNKYMHYMSSNYPAAENLNHTPNQYGVVDNPNGGEYYLLASNANDLNNIFEKIQESVTQGGTTATLTTETQIKDMISPYFELPPDASVSDIEIFTADYMGVSNGEEQWAGEQPFPGAIVELSADRKTVSVSGFDYKENWVGTATNGNITENHGQKLIIKIPIQVVDTFLGGDNVPTNTNESGIYNGDSPVEKFVVPQTDILIAELNYKNYETNIYYGNSISLQDVLDQLVKAMGNIPLQGVSDGSNNGFVDMQFALTTTINGQEKKYIYTLEAGQDWSEGTWDSESEDMSNVVLTQDTVYTVHVVLEHDRDYNTLQVSLDAVQHLVQDHYTKTTWDALLAQIAESSTKVNDRLQMERAHGNIHLFAAIDALQLRNPTGDDTADELQKLIYLAEATLALYSQDKYKDAQGKPILPYQDFITSRLAAANTALNNFKNSKTAENKLAMEATMASLREAVYSLIKFNSVEGTSTFYVYKPELTFKDSVWEYFNALFFYVNESFAQVRAALSGAINALDLGTEAISRALKNLVPVSNYGNETIRAFYNNLLIIRSLDATKYTPESYNTVNGIITELAEGGTDAKWKVDVVSATDALRTAVGALVLEEASQDSEELHRLKLWIFLAKRLEYSCYTTESYTALLTNLTDAEAVLANSEATNDERAAAANALNTAVNALVLARSSGETAIDDLQKIVLLAEGLKSADFSVGYAELDKKLVEMRESLEEITASMQRGIDGLALRTDYGHVSVNKLMVMRSVFSNVDKTQYTSTSYENLRQAVETATSDAGGNLSGKGAAIKAAIEALELVRTDKVHISLQKAILRAKSLNPAHYQDFTGVQSALTAAETALNNYKQNQNNQNNQAAAQAATALENALNALRLKNATDIQAIDELLPHLLQAEALRTMYIESSGESGYPDLQAFLESHWVGTRWLHVTMDSNGELVTTESTQVLMSGVAPKLELIFDYKAHKDPFDGGRMMLNADLTVGVTVKLIGKRTDSTIGEILLTRTDVDRIRFVHSDCAEGKLCLFNANTEEFVIHVHNTSLLIEVQGAPENSTDTFLFEIQYKDETGVNQVLYVTVQGNGYAVIAGDLSNNVVYTIKLLTDWSWQYRCNAVTIPDGSLAIETERSTDQISVKLQNTERNSNQTNHVIFHVTMEETNWLEDEDREDNNFGVFYPDKA